MWILVLSIYLAIVTVFDLLFNLIGLKVFGFTVIEISVFNTFWTFTYALGAKFSNDLVDRGLFKKSSILSVVSMFLSITLLIPALNHVDRILLYTAYLFHGIALSSTRTTVFASLLEKYESSRWSIVNRRLLQLSLLIEGFLLIIISWYGFGQVFRNIYVIALFIILTGLFAIKYTPNPTLLVERPLFSIEKNLGKIFSATDALLSISYAPLHVPSRIDLVRNYTGLESIKPSTIYYSLLGLRIANKYVLITLPYHMIYSTGIGFDNVIGIYGYARIFASLLMYMFINIDLLSRGSIASTLTIRLLSTILLYMFITNYYVSVTMLTLVFLSYALLDTILYNLYIEATYGYGTGHYVLVNEIGNLTGTLSSGLVYLYIGVSGIIGSTFLSTLFLLPLMKKH